MEKILRKHNFKSPCFRVGLKKSKAYYTRDDLTLGKYIAEDLNFHFWWGGWTRSMLALMLSCRQLFEKQGKQTSEGYYGGQKEIQWPGAKD